MVLDEEGDDSYDNEDEAEEYFPLYYESELSDEEEECICPKCGRCFTESGDDQTYDDGRGDLLMSVLFNAMQLSR